MDNIRAYTSPTRLPVVIFGVLAVLFVHETVSQGIGVAPVVSPDSGVFLNLAKNMSVFDPEFWSGLRPAGLPLFIKILGLEPRNLIFFQILFHLVAWLGFSLWLFLKASNRYLGLFFAFITMLMAASAEITLWNYHVLSEAVSLSLVPIIGVLSYEIISHYRAFHIWILIGVLVVFSLLRDANVYFVLATTIPLGGMFLAKKFSGTQLIAALVVIGLAFGIHTWSVAHSRDSLEQERWFFSFMNITGQRILTNDDILDQFETMGMPVNDALTSKKGYYGSSDDWSFYQDPELSDFRNWVAHNGKAAYARFLITNPGYSSFEIVKNAGAILHANRYYLEAYEPDGFEVGRANLSRLVPNQWLYLLFLSFGILVYCQPGVLRWEWQKFHFRSAGSLPLIALLTALPIGSLFFISFHGDAMEVSRHTLSAVVLLKVWLMVFAFHIGNHTK